VRPTTSSSSQPTTILQLAVSTFIRSSLAQESGPISNTFFDRDPQKFRMPQPRGRLVGLSVINPKDMKPYTEYQVKTTGNKTECYIESVQGQPFSVVLSLNADITPSVADTFRARCIVDGQVARSGLLGKFPTEFHRKWQVNGKTVGRGKVALFEFGATQFTGM
jgi:hypothetical protein